jgi:hypothetical protein
MKTTLGAAAYGVTRFGECEEGKWKGEIGVTGKTKLIILSHLGFAIPIGGDLAFCYNVHVCFTVRT